MDFNDNARLDTSQVSDQRGRRGGGLALGGGGLGIVGVILALILGVNPADLVGSGGAPADDGAQSTSDIAQRCQTGVDAERDEDCRIVGVVNSVQKYWESALGDRYTPTRTELFTGQTTTGCGNATSAVGPFYCPADQMIYIDLDFFQELRSKYGATGGPFAQAYVVAHEYGHHIQNLLGTSDKVQRSGGGTGPQSPGVRLELQADCYAGNWVANAVETGFLAKVTEAEVADGLDAAAAVGDDRIQEKTQGRVSPESFTHGSAAQRQKWFSTGRDTGDPRRCNTFTGTV